jgi:hypothetical protein
VGGVAKAKMDGTAGADAGNVALEADDVDRNEFSGFI